MTLLEALRNIHAAKLDGRRAAVLIALGAEPTKVCDLVDRTGINRRTVHNCLADLRAAGLVASSAVPNGRPAPPQPLLFHITARGSATLAEFFATMRS